MELKVEISLNLKIIYILDRILNLNDNSYKPFNKTKTIPTCINVSSDNPLSIIKQILNAIHIRMNRLSSSKIYSIITKNFLMVAIKMNLCI